MAGNIAFITAITGNIGYGTVIGPFGVGMVGVNPNCNTSSVPYYFDTDLGPGPGYLDSWTVDSNATRAADVSVGPWNGCPSTTFNNQIATVAFLAIAGTPLGTSTVHDVYQDTASQKGFPGFSDMYDQSGSANQATGLQAKINGTAMMASSAAQLATGELIYAADISACSPSVLGCPAVTAGGSPQNTGASGATSCVANSPVSGQLYRDCQTVANPTNLVATKGFTLAGFTGATNTAYNSGSYLVTATTASSVSGWLTGASCPTSNPATSEGTVAYSAADFTVSSSANVGPEALEGFINDASFNATISGTALTTTTSQTLTAGDFVYGAATCGANPTSCPKIATTATGTSFTLTASGGTVATPTAMNTLNDADNFNGTINNYTPGAIASGTDLLPSTPTMTTPAYISGPGITGCSTSICPFIVGFFTAVSGTSFTLNTSGGTVGSEIVTAVKQNSCTTPTVFFNNIDMTGLLTDQTAPNHWSANGPVPTVGC